MTGPINGSAAKDVLDLPAFSLDGPEAKRTLN